jgi:hypothetical protein
LRKSKTDQAILDWRSTGRRRARRVLFESRQDFVCIGCGHTVVVPPKDAPRWFEDIWPEQHRDRSQLQADHKSKDLTDNELDDLCWRCPSCHKYADNTTEKGVATETTDHGYADAYGGVSKESYAQ